MKLLDEQLEIVGLDPRWRSRSLGDPVRALTPARSSMRAKPVVPNGAPRADVKHHEWRLVLSAPEPPQRPDQLIAEDAMGAGGG
jgi:hypothetical protein